MEELIESLSNKTLEELKKSQKPPFPFYYKEVFNTLLNEKGILEEFNPKLLCLEPNLNESLLENTKTAVKHIYNASKNIKHSSKTILEEIKVINPEELKESIIKFSSSLIQNVNEMEKKINELEEELDKAYKELLIDPLTRAYNTKAFIRDLNNILKKGKEKKLDLCIALIDIDNFKSINDKYGHLIGDFVLIKFMDMIKKLIRSYNKIYRYGGDEFIIVFNRADIDVAVKSVERILNRLNKTKLKYKDNLIEFRVSVGITEHKKGDDIDSILKRADKALEEAKKTKNTYKAVL